MFNVCHSKSLSPRPWSRKAGITNTVIQLIFAGSIIITWLYIKTISVSQKQLARKSASICIRQVGRWVGVAKLGSCWLRMIKVSEETLLPSKEAFVKMCLCEVRNVQLLRKKYLFAITITIKLSECQTVRRLSFHESRGPFSTKCFTQVTLVTFETNSKSALRRLSFHQRGLHHNALLNGCSFWEATTSQPHEPVYCFPTISVAWMAFSYCWPLVVFCWKGLIALLPKKLL